MLRLARSIACASAALHLAAALALTPAPARPHEFVHQVQAGDTLYGLAERYLGQGSRWTELQSHNRLPNPERIATGTWLRIPAGPPTAASAYAKVAYVSGDVRQIRPGETQAIALLVDALLPPGTRIEAGSDGFVRLQMADGSVARLPAGSKVRLSTLQHQEAANTTRTIIEMESGQVDATVRPRRSKSSQFEIHTPLAIASVRGTEFSVAIQPDATVTADVTHGVVRLEGRRRSPSRRGASAARQLRADQGARVDGAGIVGPVKPLPAAPDLSRLPETVGDADFVRLPLPATPGIAAYRVRIASDEALEQVVRDELVRGDLTLFTGLADGSYTVGVRAADDAGLLGRESRRPLRIKATPVAPLFQRPAPDEKIGGSRVELSCTEPAGIHRFRLQIASDEDFRTLVADEPALAECRLETSLPPGRYLWRVASVRVGADGQPDPGPFSGSRRFEMVTPPASPKPVVDGGADNDGLQIHWAGVPGLRYLVQVSRDSGFAELVYSETQDEPMLSLANQAPGAYYIRIQAVDAQGQAGAFSPTQMAQVDGLLRDSSGSAVRDTDGRAVGRR